MNSSPSTTQIISATVADLPAIAELAGVIWRAHYPGIISAEQIEYMLARMYSPDTLRDELCARGIRFERLLAGGELIGFASYGPTDRKEVFKLHKIYLHPQWHGRGLGNLLLNHCADAVRHMGATRLMLAVNKRNAKAVAAYRRSGFSVAESVVTDFGNGFVMDDFIMAKDL